MSKHATKPITSVELRASKRLKTPGLYADGGCKNLYVEVKPDGGRYWCFRFTLAGRTRQMGLGPLDDMTLVEARGRADSLRALIRQGIDPIEQAKTAVAAESGPITFKQAAEAFITAKEAEWHNAKHRQQWRNTLASYAYPKLGNRPVAGITTDDVLSAIEPIWNVKAETAGRVRGRIEAVLNYAKTRGWRNGDNPALWRGHLSNVLARRSKIQPVEHEPALAWIFVPDFMRVLRAKQDMSAKALELLILTASRAGMVLDAIWPEIDLEGATWTVPAPRMKAKREHRIPLSDAALTLLNGLLPLRDPGHGDWLFPGAKAGRPLSNMAMTMLLRGMNDPVVRWHDAKTGRPIVPHGFRSSFRDWARDNGKSSEAAEAALAHVERDKVVAAYARSDLFEQRKTLMAEWAAYCTKE